MCVAVGKNDFEDDFKNVEVTLGYRDPRIAASGLLASSAGKSQALDKKTEVTNLVTICPVPGSNSTWFMADFHVDYDPCICKFRSDLEISFKFFKYSNLSLVGRGLDTEVVVDEEGTYVPEDFFSSFDSNSKAGNIVFNNLDKLLDDYEQKLIEYKAILAARKEAIEYNKEIDKKLAVVKMFRSIVIAGATNVISGGVIAAIPISYINSVLPKLVDEKKVTDPTGENDFILEQSINRSKLKSELSKGISAGFDHFAGQLYKKKDVPGEPSKPTQPTATLSEMKFVGDITNDPSPVASLPLFNPGTFGTSFQTNQFHPNSYPVYNEVLGLYATLNTPEVDLVVKDEGLDNDSIIFVITRVGNSFDNYRVEVFEHLRSKIGFKLKESLKYAFNPVLDIAEREMSANFNLRVSFDEEYDISLLRNAVFNAEEVLKIESNQNSIGISTNAVEISSFAANYSEISLARRTKTYDKTLYSKETMVRYLNPQFKLNSQGLLTDTIILYKDNFDDEFFLGNFRYDFGSEYDDYDNRYEDIKPQLNLSEVDYKLDLKIAMHVAFHSVNLRGQQNETDRIYTIESNVSKTDIMIPVFEHFVNEGIVNSNEEDLRDYVLSVDLEFDGTPKFDFEFNGNSYYLGKENSILAKNVLVSGEVNPSDNFDVNIRATDLITITSGGIVKPEVNLRIRSNLGYSTEVSDEYIEEFCGGTAYQSYKANKGNELIVPDKPVLNKFLSDDSVSLEDSKDNKLPTTIAKKQENALSISAMKQPQFYIYPNPTKDIFNIVLTTAEEYVELSISDFSGKTLQMFDYLPKTINLTDYESGVYLLKIINKTGETKIERIIKN